MGFVETIADRVTVLHQGQCWRRDPLREVQANEQVIEVYLGTLRSANVKVSQLHQYYGGSHILRGVEFSARQEAITLPDRTQWYTGKTTLLKCLMGLIPARSGEVRWQDQNITHRKPHQRVQAGVAYVPRGARIFPAPDGGRNLLMGLSRFPAREAQQVPEEIYQLFPVLRTMKQRRGGDLSGGQQQQLAIGRALASRPQLLILDEPTEGSSPRSSKSWRGGSASWRAAETWRSCWWSSSMTLPPGWRTTTLVMSRGAIVQQGKGGDMESDGVRAMVTI